MIDKFNRLINLYKNSDIEALNCIYADLEYENEKVLLLVVDILLAFDDRDIMLYEEKLLELKNVIEDSEEFYLKIFYYLRMHLLFLYREEYTKALEELKKAYIVAEDHNDVEHVKLICFQELEIATFYLRDFSLSKKLITKYENAMMDSDDIRAYFYTVISYINSYEDKQVSAEYIMRTVDILEKSRKSSYFLKEVYIRTGFVLLNLELLDKVPFIIENIEKENPERFLISAYYEYKKGNFEAAYYIFEEAYNKFYFKKRFSEYWLKFYLLAADVCEKRDKLKESEYFYKNMLEQLDYLYERNVGDKNLEVFVEHYKSYIFNALLFYKKIHNRNSINELVEKYSLTMLSDEADFLQELIKGE